jgi:hypothetical protein
VNAEWPKLSAAQKQILKDLMTADDNGIRYTGSMEKPIVKLRDLGLVAATFEIMLDGLHHGRSRRIWTVQILEPGVKLFT